MLGYTHPTGQTPPWAAIPWAATPWADIPPADGYCCGQYASYWNAFLLRIANSFLGRVMRVGAIV